MTTSNSSDPVSTTADGVASATESVQNTSATSAAWTEPEKTDAIKASPRGANSEAHAQVSPEQAAANIAAGATPEQAYNPNWKFKAYGKQYEIDEFWRGLVKDADSEKKVKDLHTRAFAFDDTKAKYESTQGEFQSLLQEYQGLDRDVKKVTKFLNDRDYDNFFRSLRIPDQEVFNWVQQKLERMNMSPEQQRAYDQQTLERQKLYDVDQERTALEQKFNEQAVQVRTMQLDMTLSRPEFSRVASQWDERMGQPGAFKAAVVTEAQLQFQTTGQDLSPDQATQLVIQKYGKLFEAPQALQSTAAPQAPAAKPVIPVIKGQGASPVKKVPKSIEELRSMADAMTS